MKKFTLRQVRGSALISVAVFLSSFQALGAEALRCYGFFGVQYKTRNWDGQVGTVEDSSKFFFDEAIPIGNQQAHLVVEKDQWRAKADLDYKYFRLEFFDKTNGRSYMYTGSSHSLAEGVDTSIFADVGQDSALRVSWEDLEHQLGDVLLDSLRAIYATVQCQKTTENKSPIAKSQRH